MPARDEYERDDRESALQIETLTRVAAKRKTKNDEAAESVRGS